MFSAPGRVNLIGEHTDYCDGFVFPAAIDFRTVVGISARSDDQIAIRSINLDQMVKGEACNLIQAPTGTWADYPIGVIRELCSRGMRVPNGLNLTIYGDVPLGSGLSSSASVEVATALACLWAAGMELPSAQIALACQSAENSFVGAQCGIMDQFIAITGESNHAVLIDCRFLNWELIPIPKRVALVISNSMISHSIAGGEYKTRREEVENGVEILRRFKPEIVKLRDVTEDDLIRFRSKMPDVIYRRCRHIVSENRRVLEAAQACREGNTDRLGRLMSDSYISYRDDFEASCPEVDLLVRAAQKARGCYGSRLTGGGFGGCTISVVDADLADNFVDVVSNAYQAATGIAAAIYCCTASQGAKRLGRSGETSRQPKNCSSGLGE